MTAVEMGRLQRAAKQGNARAVAMLMLLRVSSSGAYVKLLAGRPGCVTAHVTQTIGMAHSTQTIPTIQTTAMSPPLTRTTVLPGGQDLRLHNAACYASRTALHPAA